MLTHCGSPVLLTERLCLRPYREEDYPAVYRNWMSDPEVARLASWTPHDAPETTRRLLKMWQEAYESPCVYRWGIERSGELIGDISVTRWREEDESCELGYCLCRRFWGQGLMPEALTRVVRYLFDSAGFHRIALRHDRQNPASGRVMQKCGFRLEGVGREELKRPDGAWADVCHYALLSSDPPTPPQA